MEVRRTTGLRFSESLSGYLGEGADFWRAYRDGRSRGQSARFWVTVSIADLERFLADPQHEAAMRGRLAITPLGTLPVDEGRLHLFTPYGHERRLLYSLPFRKGGEYYLLRGEKRLHSPRGLEAWRQMTTLYAELVRLSDGGREVPLGRGVLRIGPWQVLRQALSFRPLGTLNPVQALHQYFRFLRFCSREIRSAGSKA